MTQERITAVLSQDSGPLDPLDVAQQIDKRPNEVWTLLASGHSAEDTRVTVYVLGPPARGFIVCRDFLSGERQCRRLDHNLETIALVIGRRLPTRPLAQTGAC